MQHLYRDMNFDSPFLLTYISTALFVLWIPTRLILERCGRCKRCVQRSWKRARKAVGMGGRYEVMASAELESESEGGRCRDDDEIIIPWRNDMPIAVASSDGGSSDNIEMERVREPYQSLISQQERQQKQQSSGNKNNDVATDGYKDEPNGNAIDTSDGSLSAQKDSDGDKASPTATNGAVAIGCAHQPTHQEGRRMRPQVLSHLDHMSMAVKIAPVWFLSNFFYNTSLAYTSITSSTVLASTGSLFTFLFAVSCGDERFTTPKLLGVILCFTGSVLTGLGDIESDNNNRALAVDATGEDGLGRMFDDMKSTALLSTEATRIILSGVDGSSDASSSASSDDDIVGSLVLGDLAGLISVSTSAHVCTARFVLQNEIDFCVWVFISPRQLRLILIHYCESRSYSQPGDRLRNIHGAHQIALPSERRSIQYAAAPRLHRDVQWFLPTSPCGRGLFKRLLAARRTGSGIRRRVSQPFRGRGVDL